MASGEIDILSPEQLFGRIVNRILSEAGLNDLTIGSVLRMLAEAAADNDYDGMIQILRFLDLLSIDNLTGIDLDRKGKEYSISREGSKLSSGYVIIQDTTFERIATTVYSGSTPPIAGNTLVKVADASSFPTTGSFYIGRGTLNYEGPYPYAATNNGSYWTLAITAGQLLKNHNLSESIILAQGGNRSIPAKTVVNVPGDAINTPVQFTTQSIQTLADGENILEGILVAAQQAGSNGNVAAGAVSAFTVAPFNGASVTNPSAFSNGDDLETDDHYRDRIKDRVQSLSRGTRIAILTGLIGLTDPDDNKTIRSASLIEPITKDDIGYCYIDDGTGFEPSYAGIGIESIISDANGTEERFQVGKFPIMKAQIDSVDTQPFDISGGDTLIVRVNNVEETITFDDDDFVVPGVAKAIELVRAINTHSSIVDARTHSGLQGLTIFGKAVDYETIQVVGGTANEVLAFPTDTFSTLKLYKNDVLLSKDGETAFIESAPIGQWGVLASPAQFGLSVDGKPTQYVRISDTMLGVTFVMSPIPVDFVSFTGTTFSDLGVTVATASLDHWVEVLNSVLMGVTVSKNGSRLKITSNLDNKASSSIQAFTTDLSGLPGSVDLVSVQAWSEEIVQGKDSEYTLNRFLGQGELVAALNTNDTLTIGTLNTRSFLNSLVSTGGVFSITLTDGRKPIFYAVVDGDVTVRNIPLESGQTLDISVSGDQTTFTANPIPLQDPFADIEVGDYVAVTFHTLGSWVNTTNSGRPLLDTADLASTVTVSGAVNTWTYTLNTDVWANAPKAGDILIVGAASAFNVNNRGSFTITTVTSNTITVTNPLGVAEGPIALASRQDLEVNLPALFVVTAKAANAFTVRNPNGNSPNTEQAAIVVDDPADIRAFSSTATPQLVELPIASFTPENLTIEINDQLIGATASVIQNNTIRLITNTYDVDGSIAVPVSVGDAKIRLGIEGSASSVESHVAAVESLEEAGYPVSAAKGSTTTVDVRDPYTLLTDATRLFTTDDLTRPDQWVRFISNTNKTVKAMVEEITAPTQLTLRDNTPGLTSEEFINAMPTSSLYQQFFTFDLEGLDNLVVIMDDDPANLTYNVPMGRNGRITAFASLTGFDADDIDANLGGGSPFGSDPNTIWNNYDFADYKIWFQAHNVLDSTGANNEMVFKAVGFGPTGENIRFRFVYPVTANTGAVAISYSSTGELTSVSLVLASGNGGGLNGNRPTTQNALTAFNITTGVGTITYTWDGITGADPQFTPVGGVVAGDIVTFNSSNFNSGNNGTFRITAVAASAITVSDPLGSGVAEAGVGLGAITSMQIYPLVTTIAGANSADTIIAAIAATASLNEILFTERALINSGDGSGVILRQSNDDTNITNADADGWIQLVDGENWVRQFRGSSDFILKKALTFAEFSGAPPIYSPGGGGPVIYDIIDRDFKLIPVTAKNLIDHLNRPAITALSANASILRSGGGDRIQIASLIPGSTGQVRVDGGLANESLFAVNNDASLNVGVSLDTLRVGIPTASASGFHKGQLVRLANNIGGKRINTYDANTAVTVSLSSAGVNRYTLGERSTGFTGGVTTVAISFVSGKIYRYTVGGVGNFQNARIGDELQVDSNIPFVNPTNAGNFPVVAIDPGFTYVDVINPSGVAEAAQTVGPGDIFKVQIPFFTMFPTAIDGTTTFTIEKLSQDIVRFRVTSGTSPDLANCNISIDDLVVINDTAFSAGNNGIFQITAVDANSFEIKNPNAIGQAGVTGIATGLTFYSVDSTVIGDSLYVGNVGGSWFNSKNRGKFVTTAFGRNSNRYHYVEVENPLIQAETVILGTNYVNFYLIEDSGFETYRTVANIAVDSNDPDKSFIYMYPTQNANRISSSYGCQGSALNKLGFSTTPKVGIDGYRYWTGLMRKAHRTLDGYEQDPTTYPGIKAAGVQIEILPPLVRRIRVSLNIKANNNTPLSQISDAVKSAVLAYIASLGVGEDVVLSEIEARAQAVSGVYSVRITYPIPEGSDPIIPIGDNEKAITFAEDITVS